MVSFVADKAEKRSLYEDAIQLHELAKICVYEHVALMGGVEGCGQFVVDEAEKRDLYEDAIQLQRCVYVHACSSMFTDGGVSLCK